MSSSDTSEIPEAALQALALALVPGIGPLLQQRLLQAFGSAEAVLAAGVPRLCSVAGVGHQLAERVAATTLDAARREWDFCRRRGIRLLFRESSEYPGLLREIADPPAVLFARGAFQPRDALALAVVGTRRASRYGLRETRRLTTALSRTGVTIVSGLARGVDAAAHRAALAAGGRTVAVLATGVATVYPPEHAELAQQIEQAGVVLSEMDGACRPCKGAFPRRNRLITGMSLGVLVVEASLRSGAMVSARHALEQGREVFAMPGPVDREGSVGCHALIREGATLVTQAEHVIEALGPLAQPAELSEERTVRDARELGLNPQEAVVLQSIAASGSLIDEIIVRAQLPAGRVLATLSVLEVRQLVTRLPGARFSRR